MSSSHPILTEPTFEQHPPKINPSIAPTASHCGMVSIKILPTSAISLEKAGRESSMPFSSDSRASMIFGVMMSPSVAVLLAVVACSSRSVDRRRWMFMGFWCWVAVGTGVLLFESALLRLPRAIVFVLTHNLLGRSRKKNGEMRVKGDISQKTRFCLCKLCYLGALTLTFTLAQVQGVLIRGDEHAGGVLHIQAMG